MQRLRQLLSRIDGKGYKAYKELEGKSFSFPGFELFFYHVQGDPFAAPSQLAVRMPQKMAGFPADLYCTRVRSVALGDFITRAFHKNIGEISRGRRGSGKGGAFSIDRPGQEVLERSSVAVSDTHVEVRFFAGLPAAGRRILGREAAEMFLDELPLVVENSLIFKRLPQDALYRHLHTVEDQEAMRAQLAEKGLVAFVADGSILPRRSGVDQRPLDPARAVPFKAPPALAVELACPHRGRVRGMGLPAGVTLIAGGGYHGKSTLLRALERGVYNHIPGDGREGVVADPLALKIRAEDGRRVEKVDISPFIGDLPFGRSTRSFSTEEASGSTSQAANIIEGLEAGARVLLMDEDTSATNFMIRDRRMQLLVAKDKEPITPFVDRVRQLYRERGVSTILVIGGSGDYFDVADTVIVMESYLPREATAAARQIASRCPTGRRSEAGGAFGEVRRRVPLPGSIDPYKGRRVKISARDEENLLFGSEKIDLRCLEQIVDQSQVRAIGDLIFYALKEKIIDGKNSLAEIAGRLEAVIEQQGLAVISPYRGQPRGDYARPRPLELVAAINRLRTLEIRPG